MNPERKILFEKTKLSNVKIYRMWVEGYSRPAYVEAEEIKFIGSSIVFLTNEEIIKIVPQASTVVTLSNEQERNEHRNAN